MPKIDSSYIPEPPDKYKGNQAIITSDRVLFNARTDSVLIFAKQSIALSSAGTLNFDSDKKCIINSPQIQLGLKATEPLLLGNKTTEKLSALLDKLGVLSDALSKASVFVGSAEYPLTEVNLPAQDLKQTIDLIKSSLNEIKSKQNFTL